MLPLKANAQALLRSSQLALFVDFITFLNLQNVGIYVILFVTPKLTLIHYSPFHFRFWGCKIVWFYGNGKKCLKKSIFGIVEYPPDRAYNLPEVDCLRQLIVWEVLIMFDNLKGLSGLADLTKPKSLDLGDYDRAASWIRDSAFTAHELGISPGVLRDLLDSWLNFVSQFDNINDHEMLSLTALTILIYIELTGIYYPFNIKSYFEGVE